MSTNCLNCGTHLQESFTYCPQCSQKKDVHRISFHDLLHDAIHYVTHADKGFLYLLRSLATSTGTVAREFVEGKRKKYFPPLNFYLIVAGIFVLTMTTLEEKSSPDVLIDHPELNQIKDPAEKQRVVRIYERRAEAIHFTNQYSNILAFIAVPLIAFIYWLMYRKGRYNYVEHLIAGMYMNGFTNLFYVLLFAPIFKFFFKGESSQYIVIYFLAQVAYTGFFYYKFINRQTKAGLVKALSVALLTIVVWAALTSASIGIYISNGFWGLAE